jgi:hypothetical protein
MRRVKRHSMRLKTFSTTPESRFRDQGSEVQILSPRPLFSMTYNRVKVQECEHLVSHQGITSIFAALIFKDLHPLISKCDW